MNDVAIGLEHVHFLDGLDWLHVHLLESGLQLLVVGAGALVDLLDLSSWCALASVESNVRLISPVHSPKLSMHDTRISDSFVTRSRQTRGVMEADTVLTLQMCQ